MASSHSINNWLKEIGSWQKAAGKVQNICQLPNANCQLKVCIIINLTCIMQPKALRTD
jgi:hypothetical protein